jgi:hypothetical protein
MIMMTTVAARIGGRIDGTDMVSVLVATGVALT